MKFLKYTAAAALGAAAAFLFIYFALAGLLVEAVLHIGDNADTSVTAAANDAEKVYITADDGVTLAALCYRQEEESGKWALIMHGYTSGKENMLPYAQKYYEQGFSVIVPDQRAHGESGGEYCTMGWTERLDVIRWCEYIAEESPNAELTVHGISMGAATVVMAAGEGLPENVRAVVSDCAFTDVEGIMRHQLTSRVDDSAAALCFGGSLVTKLRTGSGWREASALEMAARSSVPMLFIHGGADDFVPTEMAYELYAAAGGEKAIFIVPGALHAQSMYKDTENYWIMVFDFVLNNSSVHKNG